MTARFEPTEPAPVSALGWPESLPTQHTRTPGATASPPTRTPVTTTRAASGRASWTRISTPSARDRRRQPPWMSAWGTLVASSTSASASTATYPVLSAGRVHHQPGGYRGPANPRNLRSARLLVRRGGLILRRSSSSRFGHECPTSPRPLFSRGLMPGPDIAAVGPWNDTPENVVDSHRKTREPNATVLGENIDETVLKLSQIRKNGRLHPPLNPIRDN